MIENLKGGYDFIPGTDYLSFGAVAKQGFAIERAVLRNPQPVENALAIVEAHLASIGRPLAALCGFEFRQYLTRQPAYEEFAAFNAKYIQDIRAANLLVGDRVPVARTNVIMNTGVDRKGGFLFAFSYTVPDPSPAKNFVMAAIPEVRFKSTGPEIVEAGQTSPEATQRKIEFILDASTKNLAQMGVTWDDVTGTQLYCEIDVYPWAQSLILPTMKTAGWRGIQWHRSVPPASPAIIEFDFRSVRADLMLG